MNKSTALELYRTMVLIREFEEKLFYLFSTRSMPGSMHQYNGQEAVAAGVCAHLSDEDYITSTHRGHGHCIAKGADINRVMAEMFAKSTGCCKGLGGSMHIADFNVGMLGANAIVAGGIPIAVGAAWSCSYLENENISLAFFGDGASNEGVFHEALNLASVWQLPVVFVCENNLYGFSTHYRRVANVENIADRAASYGIRGVIADGMDVRDVYEKGGECIRWAREGEGPAILECKTYRFRGHSRFEPAVYRGTDELEKWIEKDPIPQWKNVLIGELKIPETELSKIESDVQKIIEESVVFAEASPDPEPAAYKDCIFK